ISTASQPITCTHTHNLGLGGIAAQYQLVTYLEGAEALQSQDGNGTGVYVERVLAQWAVEYLMTFFGEITD
ncbi:hypothetical protein SARC_10125, partial [Sphaeroforma arctica JP610]